jgi:hypothetical protein
MGRFHPIDGQFLSGNGKQITVDGNVLHEHGTAAQWWFDHELNLWTALAQINDGGEAWRVATYRNGSWVTVLPHGANEIQAGGDLYLAMFNGQPFSNVPLEPGMVIPPTHGEGRGYGAPDSTIAVRPGAELPGLILRRRHAEEGFTVPGVSFAPMNVDVINRDQVTCDDGAGRLVGFGMKLGELLPRPARIRYRVVDQQPWVTYYTAQHELYVSHPVNDLEHGRVIPDRTCYHHDVGFRGGRLFFGASSGKQELPNENILHDILDLDVTNLRELDGGHPDEPPVVAIGRDCYVCWFEHEAPPANQEHHPPGNALLRIYGHPHFAQVATLDGRQVFNTAGLGPAETVEGIEATVAASPLPCYVYWDANGWPRWPQVRTQDFLDVRAYWTPGMSLAALEADVRARLTAAPTGPWLSLTCQCFNNPGASADLQALVPMYSRVVRDHPLIRMVVIFNDAGRGNTGLAGNPDVRPLWDQFFAGVTGLPDSGTEPPTMNLPAAVQASISRFVAKFPIPQGLPPGDAAKEAMRPYMRQVAEQVAHDVDPSYGCKSTGPGGNQSPDALAQPRSGSSLLWIWDIFVGTGTGNPQLNLDAESEPDHLSGQHFIPVTPTDHVGGDTPDPPDPPTGSLNVLIHDYDKTVRRSDPKGMLIRFEVESDQPVIEVTLDLVEDGEPEIPIGFKAARAQDGRYVRALAFKPTVNGDFTLRVSAKDATGRTGSTDGPEPVHVTV